MILLTGATGFVGNEILTHFRNNSFSAVRTYGRHSSSSLSISGEMVEHVVGEIGTDVNYAKALHGVDVIIHCAALAHVAAGEEAFYQCVNASGTIELAKQAQQAGVKRFVFVSSIGVNGQSTKDTPFSVASTVHPHNAYARSKYNAEVGLLKIANETGFEVVIVRPTLVYGANAPGNFGALIKLVRRLPVLPFGLVKNRRHFISVKNLADLLVTCAIHPNAAGHTFLASDGEAVSIKEFTNAIAVGLNKNVLQLPIPVSLMRFVAKWLGKSTMAEQLLGNLEVESRDANNILEWQPPFTMKQAMQSLKESNK